MNEITKLYENAGVNPIKQGYCDWDCDCPYPDISCGDDCSYWKYEDETKYPPFTAEKQIELIKWLINEVDYITMWHFNNSKKPYDFDLGSRNSGGETFEDALTQMINNLWQDLTEEERKQIKEILSE